jgi:hypothetical protein
VPEGTLRFLVTQAALALLCGSAVAEDPKQSDPAADAELLEFLGSVDSGADSQATADDGSWIDYLSQTDIGKVVKATDPKEAPGKQTATEAQPPPGDKKDD